MGDHDYSSNPKGLMTHQVQNPLALACHTEHDFLFRSNLPEDEFGNEEKNEWSKISSELLSQTGPQGNMSLRGAFIKS